MIADFISLKRMNYVFIAKTLKIEGLFLLLGELFIEGACDRFFIE